MANSGIEVIYKALKDKYEPLGVFVRYPYSYDKVSIPYIYMSQVDDPLEASYLCDASGGLTRITIGYLSETFEDCVDYLKTIQAFAQTLIGVYAPVTINSIDITSELDLSALDLAQEKTFRRQFDLLVDWSI